MIDQPAESAKPREDMKEMQALDAAYMNIPILEQTRLPRGGSSIETKAVGCVQVCTETETMCEYFLVEPDDFVFVSQVWNSS